MNEYFVKVWVRVNAENKREAEKEVEMMLELDHIGKWITDYKILDTIEVDKITAEWER